MSKGLVIAIDGPAGAGKSTVAKLLAKKLGLRYLDTGAMYRALALKALRSSLGPQDGAAAAEAFGDSQIRFEEGEPQKVFLDGEEVTLLIREPAISELASALSTYPGVRKILTKQQKAIAACGGLTLEGRDATTVIAPDADLKVFLTASLEERAKRRFQELLQKGVQTTLEEVLQDMAKRDHRDYTREDSPLQLTPDTHRIESYGLSPEAIAEEIIKRLNQVKSD